MKEDPLDAVYSYVERAYIRLQAGDTLMRCIDEGSPDPMHQLVEALILAGPQSITVVQEILAETGHRKTQVMDDLHQIFSELETNLTSYGMHFSKGNRIGVVVELTPNGFLKLLQEQNILEEEAQIVCLQIWENSRDLMKSLVVHIRLLEEIETYLQDWLWALAFQSARSRMNDSSMGVL